MFATSAILNLITTKSNRLPGLSNLHIACKFRANRTKIATCRVRTKKKLDGRPTYLLEFEEKWFHPNISGREAEQLLKERGFDGSFLVRPSKSNLGDFTLSVRREGTVSHIKIQSTGDCYDLYEGEQFASLADLVFHYMQVQPLRQKDGTVLEIKYPLSSTPDRWFYGNIRAEDAETYLKQDKAKNGSYLVRKRVGHRDDFALAVRWYDRVIHIVIHHKIIGVNSKYGIEDDEQFDSLKDLLEHYKTNPLTFSDDSVIYLEQSLNESGTCPSHFLKEFEQLQKEESKLVYSKQEGKKSENVPKNRYKNILPFDHTRVILSDGDPNMAGSDYINANIITMEKGKDAPPDLFKTYIATQGCLPTTVQDFWRMVWQENSRVIVMTTKEVEGRKNKCVRYWPPENQTNMYDVPKGKIIVENLKQTSNQDFVLTEIELSRESANPVRLTPTRRNIYHYQFHSWPDHGVPNDPGSVLNFLQSVNQRQRSIPEAGPVIVHCSAGIGRTGTFIVIDMLLNQIAIEGLDCEIDLQKTVRNIRSQRSGMVQTEAQYNFIYQVIQHYRDESIRQQAEERSQVTGCEYMNLRYDHQMSPSRQSKQNQQKRVHWPRKTHISQLVNQK